MSFLPHWGTYFIKDIFFFICVCGVGVCVCVWWRHSSSCRCHLQAGSSSCTRHSLCAHCRSGLLSGSKSKVQRTEVGQKRKKGCRERLERNLLFISHSYFISRISHMTPACKAGCQTVFYLGGIQLIFFTWGKKIKPFSSYRGRIIKYYVTMV